MQRSIVEEFARGVIRTFELPKGRSRSQYHHDADFTDRKELITTKRMERRSPGGRLISVTDMRTRHFDDTRPRQYSPPPPIREERRSRYDDFYAQRFVVFPLLKDLVSFILFQRIFLQLLQPRLGLLRGKALQPEEARRNQSSDIR